MATSSQKVKLGFFLAITTALLITVVIVFAGLSVLKGEKEQYILYDESVSGLQVGAKVKLNGVDVGSVTKISNDIKDVEKVRVDVMVKESAPIKEDSKAYLVLQGITGLKYIDIRGGTKSSPDLPAGAAIEPGVNAISKMMDHADKYMDRVEQILKNIEDITGGENKDNIKKSIQHLEKTLVSIDQVAAQLAAMTEIVNKYMQENPESVGEFVKNIGQISTNLKYAIGSANRLIGNIDHKLQRADIAETVNGLNRTNEQVQAILKQVESENTVHAVVATLQAARQTLEQVAKISTQNQDEVRAATRNLRQATDSFKQFAKTIEEKPDSLIFGNTPAARQIP